MKIKVGNAKSEAKDWLKLHEGHKVKIAMSSIMGFLEIGCAQPNCARPKFLRILKDKYPFLEVEGRVD